MVFNNNNAFTLIRKTWWSHHTNTPLGELCTAMATEADGPDHAAKKRRIGQRQRLALIDHEQAAKKETSELAEYLVEQWGWAHISPQTVQQVASTGCSDMTDDAPLPLQKLGRLGGGYSNKMSADMISSHKSQLPAAAIVSLPYKKGSFLQKLLLPHEMLAAIFHNYRGTFENMLVGPHGNLEKIWRCSRHHPGMALHPALGNTTHLIPIGIHGDGVPIVGKGKIWCKSAWV